MRLIRTISWVNRAEPRHGFSALGFPRLCSLAVDVPDAHDQLMAFPTLRVAFLVGLFFPS